ncbi:MAG TPA: polynucleotide adenylyltransferase PcnB [Xanthomonadales bacterium]|nr:polynucleotide adenylyltransferase PcnB [Xanthomonadales bacterium]
MIAKANEDLRTKILEGTITKLITIPASQHRIAVDQLCPVATEVVSALQQAGYMAFIVGGSVRDLLLGKKPKDFDVATDATPEQVKHVFPRCRLIGRRFRLAHVRQKGVLIEVATFRGSHDAGKGGELQDGRIIRDNVWGSLEEDAMRRDFTINALFLDPVGGDISDFTGGYEDLLERRLRLVGDPETRYREDPVRLLRAARFVAKLGVEADERTSALIPELAFLLADVPPARLFEEVCKLFLTGHAMRSFEALQRFGLSTAMFPALKPSGESGKIVADPLLMQALRNTDDRVSRELPVTPSFLFASLLWQPVWEIAQQDMENGITMHDSLLLASEPVFSKQSTRTAVPRRFSSVSREIWVMQARLQKTRGKRALRILADRTFRAAYDFLLLRAGQDTELEPLAEFWTKAQVGYKFPARKTEARRGKPSGRRRRKGEGRRGGRGRKKA